ncbi:polysaccharide deacetylase family protein [Spirulina subsalsa FACHB-351]|uniref:Polysaccharide deacetylase family protein n=1 Tax=Spirulina subsalsa FACHB-351 TaxID=234711 RepID=A0ABT3L0B8_9CYAN|nr:polysaccharide deacetylase family protein [Spirulina subsalsa]MCW6034941.1 polysaccharide deacetylase family protein [Spirulina subsalsa FACHB-351]
MRRWKRWFLIMVFLGIVLGSTPFPLSPQPIDIILTPEPVNPELPPLPDFVDHLPEVLPPAPIRTPPPQFQGKVVYQVDLPASEKAIALTFDDGPWQNSDRFLEVLDTHQVKATFFVVGQHLELYPQVAQHIVEKGHIIANHSWNHTYHPLSPTQAATEVKKTENEILRLTGVKTTLFRPPGGVLDNGMVAQAKSQNYTIIMWSIDPQDYTNISAPTITQRVLSQAKSGGIILLHDGGGNRRQTLEALPQIISHLKQQGYEFLTLPELLAKSL